MQSHFLQRDTLYYWSVSSFNLTRYYVGASLPSMWHVKLLLDHHFLQRETLNYYWRVTSFNATLSIIIGVSLPSTRHIKLSLECHFLQRDMSLFFESHFLQCNTLNYYWSITSFNMTRYYIEVLLPSMWHVKLSSEHHFL